MQDYDGPPPYHPLVGEGAWPDHYVNMVAIILLIALAILCYLAYRAGQRAERRERELHHARAPGIIYHAVRRQIDIALIATGEKAFGPVRTLLETIDAYLGPVLALAGGGSMIASIGKLKSAMHTTKRKPDSHGPAHSEGHSVHTAGGPGNAVAAVAAAGGVTVQVVQPPQASEHDKSHGAGHGAAHGAGHGGHELELSSRERALAVREALEALAEYWQKERVERDLTAAQGALLISKPIGGGPGAPTPPASRPARLPRPTREGRPARPKPKTF